LTASPHVPLALALTGLLLVTEYAAGKTQPVQPDSGVTLERPGWERIAPGQFATVRTRRAAALIALIPALLFFVLFVYRRRPYLLAWIGAWLMTSVMSLLGTVAADLVRNSPSGNDPPLLARLCIAGSQAAGVLWPALTWLGVHRLRPASLLPRWQIVALLLCILMVGVTTLLGPVRPALIAGYSVIGLTFTAAAITTFFGAKRTRHVGAVLLGGGFTGIAATEFTAAALVALGLAGVELPNRLIFVNAAWCLLLILGMFVVVFEDMASELALTNEDLARAQRELEALAVTDALTGCFNRRFFDEVISRELRQHRRLRMPLSILFLDCDRFKLVNDTRGHDMGDRVLQAIAGVLKARVREADYVFRWGGDEFMVLMSCDELQAAAKAREIRDAFANLPLLEDLPAGIRLSVGWIGVPPDVTDVLPFIQIADQRMYAQKKETA
jgi:diguanylate cyclase (GGDEF)-like protein